MTRKTTADDPFRIDAPVIGFLNLRGSAGEAAMAADRQVLQPLFAEVRESRDAVPACAVLFLYADLAADSCIISHAARLRDLIQAAGAYIAVVASENPPEHYRECLGPRRAREEWTANIVMTLDRKGDALARFFAQLFRRMYAGESMLMAWVALAPQIPGYDDPHAPATIMAAEAGHLVFGAGP